MTLLKTLKLSCFRNLTQISFSPSSRTLIVGDNGQGKTNLLEALVLVAGGRSFRPSLPESLVQKGENQAFLSAELFKKNQKMILSLSLDNLGKKQFFLNGKKALGSSLAQELPIILFSPESLNLLKGSAEQRRTYMDEWLNMLGHSVLVREFKKALAQKNRFLKESRLSLAPFSKTLWESINTVFIEKSLQLSNMREKALLDLSDFLQQTGSFLFAHSGPSPLPKEAGKENQGAKNEDRSKLLQEEGILPSKGAQKQDAKVLIVYKRKGLQGVLAKDRKSLFEDQVWAGADKERVAGVSLYGAHRDDIVLSLNGEDSRYFCSQGQQRGLILALKMAQTLWLSRVLKTSPLLLLDDIFSEIDDFLLLNLLHFLESLPVQTILTSTREPLFLNKKNFQKFYLKKGSIFRGNTYEQHSKTKDLPSLL